MRVILPRTTFVDREVDLREALTDIGYGPELAAVGPDRSSTVALSIGTRGVPSHLRLVDVSTGAVQKGATIRGSLRDAWRTDDLWILATYALHRVSARDLSLKETLKVPKFLWRFVPLLSSRFLALSQPGRTRTTVLSLDRGTLHVVGMPTPDISIDDGDRSLVLSFWAGEARQFDAKLKAMPERRTLPLGLTPIADRGVILFLRATREVARNVLPPQPDVKWLYPTGTLALFDPTSWTVSREASIGPVDKIVGLDGGGRAIATDYATKRLTLIDPATLNVLARHEFSERAIGIVQAGRFSVAYRPRSGRLRVIDWSSTG